MQSSQLTIETRPAPRGHRLLGRVRRHRWIDRLISDWETTPGKLRLTRVVLVLGVLLAGGAGVGAANVNAESTSVIQQSIEQLNNVTTLYRSLAYADSTVASGFLSGGVEPNEMRQDYDRAVDKAMGSLARVGVQGAEDLLTTDRIADITAQVPVYTGLVERARANNRQGYPVGGAYLQRASELMQNSILPEAEKLQREQAARLDEAYRQAGSVPVLALAGSAMSLAGLIWAQVFLFRRTHRFFNIGLITATVVVLVGLLWWIAAGMLSAGNLRDSAGHSQAVSDALSPAQITALQARAAESLALVAPGADSTEQDFQAQMLLLMRDNGAGGALGAARKFATDERGRDLVEAAVDKAIRYNEVHQKLGGQERDTDPIRVAVGDAAKASAELDSALDAAVSHEGDAFEADIRQAQGWLAGMVIGTGVLAVIAALGVALGIRQRLEEYR